MIRNLLLVGLALTIGCSIKVNVERPEQIRAGQHVQSLEKGMTVTVKTDYLLYLPADYETGDTKWPLILFLHGAAERGSDPDSVRKRGLAQFVEEKENFPFIVVSPQCPAGKWWDDEVLLILLDDIINRYRVDEDRVYCTGLSMGGYGTWNLAVAHPDRFAAIAPVCGGGDPKEVAGIKDIPVWVFHGARDDRVPIERSEVMVEALKATGGNVQFTVYPEALESAAPDVRLHDVWTEVYFHENLYDWFLQHRRVRSKEG